uniref:uncharacterized protein LOC122600617 n=1 Tax=Erigeron canadensis TaxID=72917 RepID=UPI001CB8FF6B|nr:uncharacterized protein LOC122600617 [Erigeron canadensis]
MFRDTCFGHWLDITFTDGDPHLVHLILQTQIDVDLDNDNGHDPLIYNVRGHNVQFGRVEFCLITGLLFGPLDWSLYRSGNIPFRDRVFGHIQTDMVHLQDFRDTFDSQRFHDLADIDAIRICLVMCLEYVFNGREVRYVVDREILRLVEDLEAWNTFPWGSYVWPSTYVQLRNAIATRRAKHLALGPSKIPKYTMTGFIWAFKIWILETFLVGCPWWRRNDSVIPRAIGWHKTKPFKQYHLHFFEYIDDDHPPVHPLVPRPDESVTPWWIASCRFFDGLVDCVPPPAKKAKLFSRLAIQTHLLPYTEDLNYADTIKCRPKGTTSHCTLEEWALSLERAHGELHTEFRSLKTHVSTLEHKVEIMLQGKDGCWEHCVIVDALKQKLRCNYCGGEFNGGVCNMNFHLAQIKNKDIVPCMEVPDDVRDHIRVILSSPKKHKAPKKQNPGPIEVGNDHQNSSSFSAGAHPNNPESDGQYNSSYSPLMSPCPHVIPLPVVDDSQRQKQSDADKKVALFFLHNAIPFCAANSVYYQEMVDAIAECGVDYKAPSYEHMRSSLLERVKDNFGDDYMKLRDQWKETGCTILCDRWISGKTKSLIVFSVSCPKGTLYLKSADVSDHADDAQYLGELLESAVLEVGIEDIIQVLTDSTSSFVYAGRLLMAKYPSIFCSTCASLCVTQILEDFSKHEWIKTVLEEANTMTTYIYSDARTLNKMRKYTGGMELIRAKFPKYVAIFLTLKLLINQEDNLKNMFYGAEWVSPTHSRQPDSEAFKSLLYSIRFWKSANEAVSVSEPLVKLLRILEGDMPAMGHIYAGMERAKMAIKAYYNDVGEKYMPIWEIIDRRWNTQLLSPLYAAAAFLNPSIVNSLNFKNDMKMRNGFQEVMLKMATEDKTKFEITKEHTVYLNAQVALGTDFAIMGRTLNAPGDWWSAYGYETPTLQRVAIRILSQPCSSHWCKWNKRIFESVHAKRRNRMEQEKFNDLIFVHCNLWLQEIVRSRHGKCKPSVFDEVDVVSEWPTELHHYVPPLDDSWLDTLPIDYRGSP